MQQDALLRLAAVVDARSLRVALRDSIQELLPSTERSKAIAVLLVGCNPLSDQDELHLNMLEKHASVACVRVQVVQTSYQRPPLSPSPIQSHNALLHLNVSDQDYCELDRNILQLCGELYDLDAASLQLKVINYVVGDKVLEEEISFPLMFGRFGQVVEKKKSITLQDISAEERRQLSSMLGCEISSMLCVPVASRATGQVVALACAFNKQGGQRHTEADEHAIQHCFCYTSTVLTSTLAFQKEQKLKVECQALLQVAKNLFTHLDDVSVLLQEIIVEARNLSGAEICSVFLLDRLSHELVAKVFDGGVVSDEE
eukprot:superscaffoldBa00002280_g13756